MSFALKLSAVEHAQEEAAEVTEEADLMTASGAEVCSPSDGFEVVESRSAEIVEESPSPSADSDVQPVHGEIQRPNGAVFTGQVLRGFASGKGKQKWPSGAIYDGDWMDDTMNGMGTLITPDGATYVGSWSESRQHGEGKYTAPDRGWYEGQWNAGKMHGKGVYHWPDGAIFEGQFVEGEKKGEGMLRYANTSKYEGAWLDSKQHGIGVFTTKDGRSRRGEWNNGARLRWLDDVIPEHPKRVQTPRGNFEIEEPLTARQSRVGSCTERCTRTARTLSGVGRCSVM